MMGMLSYSYLPTVKISTSFSSPASTPPLVSMPTASLGSFNLAGYIEA